MDDLRIDAHGYGDAHEGQEKEEAKKRSKPHHFETEEPVDEVTLSAGAGEEPPAGYSPASFYKESK
jgi:hypothetical protein